jgi:hypothetical protein
MSRFTLFSLLAVVICVLITGCYQPQKQTVNHVGHERNLSDIRFTADLTQEQVVTIWGQPDGYRGSGIAYVEYTLKDGQEVWMTFLLGSPHRLNWALLFPVGGGKPKTLFAR